jgi:Ca2+-transporting ATPase
MSVYALGLRRLGPGPAAQTMAFASLMGAQLLHAQSARAGQDPEQRWQRPRNRTLEFGLGLSALLQLVALFVPPVRGALGGAALGLAELGIALLGAVAPVVAIEAGRRTAARSAS